MREADDPDDFDDEHVEALLGLIGDLANVEQAVVEQLVERPDPDAYLAWAKATLPSVGPALFDASSEPEPVVACWLARELWNVMPVEANGFEPVPMPLPAAGAPCPCGSGRTWGVCCAKLKLEMPVPPGALWQWLVLRHPDSYWLRHARSGTLPIDGVMHVARSLHEAGAWKPLADLLAPKMAAALERPEFAPFAIDWLCAAYEGLQRIDDRDALLKRLGHHDSRMVRTMAGRRLTLSVHRRGDWQCAWRLFRDVSDANPDDPATGVLELALLANERRFAEAEQRADYWRNHLLDADLEPDDEFLHLITVFAEDARDGRDEYYRRYLPDELGELVDWIDEQLLARPLPKVRWRRVEGMDDDDFTRGAHMLDPSPTMQRLEYEWQEEALPEFALVMDGEGEEDDWPGISMAVDWLFDNPDAADSLVVLDDLAAILAEAATTLGSTDNHWYMMVVERGAATLREAWSAKRGTVPWAMLENRPPLRLLCRYIGLLDEDEDPERVEEHRDLYLRLNPNDNEGYRNNAVDSLLGAGRNAEALQLAERYPNDMFAETRYGRVLALYRLGRLDEARDVMDAAAVDLPLVLKYLLRNRIEQPAADGDGSTMVIGGEYQAWLYRDDMREAWMAEPGLKEWLAQFVQKAQQSLRKRKRRRRR